MEFLGFSKDAILRFKSYLSNRKFKVNLNKTFLDQGKLLYIFFKRDHNENKATSALFVSSQP